MAVQRHGMTEVAENVYSAFVVDQKETGWIFEGLVLGYGFAVETKAMQKY